MSPQNKAILKWFKDNPGKYLTTLIAMRELGCCRLSERCREIHYSYVIRKGCTFWPYDIKKEWQTVKTSYGKTRVMGYKLRK